MKRVAGRSVMCALWLLAAPGHRLPAQAPAASTLAERIQRIVDRAEFRHAIFGIEFYSLDAGKPIYTLNADKLFVPASTTKLLTEGTALALLGADYRFHTRVYGTGPVTKDGTLTGDLVLLASGDPNLSARVRANGTLAFENEDHAYAGSPATRAVPGDPLLVIRELARQVAGRAVRHVRGRVLVDATMFQGGDRELGTGVVISPIVVNDNMVDVTIGPGSAPGAPTTLSPSPATSYVRFINHVTTAAAGSPPNVDLASDVTGVDGVHTVTATGTMPAGAAPILYAYPVPDPPRFAEVVFTEALRQAGVLIESVAPSDTVPDWRALGASYAPEHLVAEHVSPPLREEVKVTLKVSQNLHASMMPRLLRAVLAPRDTSITGFDLERQYLTRAGLDLTGAQQADGAGGDAHFTPGFIVSYLTYMTRQRDYAAFHDALPILGRDGTLVDIQPSSPAAGHVYAKTGTNGSADPLNRRFFVSGKGLAGYLTAADGRHLAFALYVNNVSVSADPDAITAVTGQALGEIAAAAYAGP